MTRLRDAAFVVLVLPALLVVAGVVAAVRALGLDEHTPTEDENERE